MSAKQKTDHRRAYWITSVVALATLLLTQLVAYQRYNLTKDELRREVLAEANDVQDRIKAALNDGLTATRTLAFIVEKYGEPGNFDSVAHYIMASNRFIDALELTNEGLITHVYPLNGNETAIGYDILLDTVRRHEALRAIEKRSLYFAGPFELKQGGTAVVGRLPMFRDNEFIGFSVALIKLSSLLGVAGIENSRSGFSYQLSKRDPVSREEHFFLPPITFEGAGEMISVEVPDGDWILYVRSQKDILVYLDSIAFSVFGLVLTALFGLNTWQITRQPEKLKKMVAERTSELMKAKNLHQTTLDRVSDAFIAYDADWRYTYINKRAAEILNLQPEVVIGKRIWDEFPELAAQPIYEAYHKAMREQRPVFMESCLENKNQWFENHIYPSADGLSVFFRDITAARLAKKKIEDSEKYYRALIEKSSEAVVLLDSRGKVLYQTPSTEKISGYSQEELQKLDGLEIIHPEDRQSDAEVFSKLVQSPGTSLQHIHRLKHKLGHYIWIEGTYTNFLDVDPIHAIVYNYRDCTHRIESERKVVTAGRLYHVISKVNQTIVHVPDEETLFRDVCEIAVDIGKFSMAWIGMIDKETQCVLPVMHAGVTSDYLSKLSYLKPIDLNDPKLRKGPTGKAIQTGTYVICADIEDDPDMRPWAADALNLGFRSSISLPIRKFGQVVGAFSLYASEPHYFDDNEVALLLETTGDVSFTLENLERERMRRNAEQLAQAAQREKEATLNRINDAVVSVDNEWRYTFLNDAALTTHPLGREGTIGKTMLEIHPEMEGTAFWNMYTEAKKTMHTLEMEDHYAPMDIWFSVKAYPSADGLTIFYADITNRKRAESLIEAERNLSNSVINSLPGVFYLYDKNGKFLRWNKNLETVSGYSQLEIADIHPLDFFLPDEKSLVRERIEQVFSKGEADVTASFLTKNQQKIPFYFTGKKVNFTGADYLIGVGIDISDRVNAEKKIVAIAADLAHLIENANAIIFGVDITGAVNEWNMLATTITGYSRNEMMTRKLANFIITPERKQVADQLIGRVLTGELVSLEEFQIINKSGEKKILLLSATPRRAENGEIIGLIAVGQDVTELTEYRHSLENKVMERTRELKIALEKEKELATLKNRFASMVSHEFRTPLATIRLAINQIKKYKTQLSPNAMNKKIGTIIQQVDHMGHLLEDVLTLGKAQDTGIRINRSKLNLESFCKSIKEQLETVSNRSHAIVTRIDLNDPEVVTDEGLLRNILINLLGNSIKFSPGKENVELMVNDRDGIVHMEVRDHGIGIPDEDLKRVFKPFDRGSNSEGIPGTGLGLSIVSKAVDLLQGTIDVRSKVGEGTVFSVNLPRR